MADIARRAPTLYHVGKKNSQHFLRVNKGIFIWINHNLKLGEMRYLYTLMQCAGDGSFCPSATYIEEISGLNKVNQSKARACLKEMGILEHEDKKYIRVRYDKLEELARGMIKEED